MIESYEFGKMKIAGKIYTSDLIVFPDRIIEKWWRKEGHRLCLEDLKDVIEFKPEVLVIGTGYNARMMVPGELMETLEKIGIKTIALPTQDAVKVFNETKAKKVGAFHLTC